VTVAGEYQMLGDGSFIFIVPDFWMSCFQRWRGLVVTRELCTDEE